MVKIGLLGARHSGTVHEKSITAHAGSTLAAVADVNADAARTLADEYGAQVRRSEEIIADPSIGAVLIATSTDTHTDLCTHGQVHLADGLVMDDIIECPKHNGRFNYKTGQAKGVPVCVNLRTYPVKVEAGTAYMRIG